MRVDTRALLERLGYNYYYEVEEASNPDYADAKFSDLVPEFSGLNIGGKRLYRHQLEAFEALKNGENVILISGTGSGKTEAWVLYVLDQARRGTPLKVIAVYPTLALANDQVKRIAKYSGLLKIGFTQLDSIRVKRLSAAGRRKLVEEMGKVKIVVTNPAFLLNDLKKFLITQSSALLHNFYKGLDLLVIDEIDFYSPRSLALLLAMLKILGYVSDKKPQVAVLGATISNPEDLGVFLEEVTGRKYRVIRGKPFRVENRTYIVLGKNLRERWERVRREVEKPELRGKIPEEVRVAMEKFDVFAERPYFYLQYLESLGLEVPPIHPDYIEILSGYLADDYVTIVFTRGISQAEEVLRDLKNRLGEGIPAATHHHLVPKERREEIEEKTRKGLIKLLISPRTLSQGIDIGEVARVVHLGLPDDVREYYQREGRKGRRSELGYSETVIIPTGRWDRELLANGFDALKEWLNLGAEKTIINPGNLYLHLFLGLSKLLSPWFKSELSELEKGALEKAGLLSSGKVSLDYLRRVYERINFYEYAPPYGIKRYLVKGDRELALEPIGHCDLVERFQPGCIDYGEEAIVVSLEKGRSTRHVARVVEKGFREIDFYQDDAFRLALEEYRYIKDGWGEKPNILRDILAGRISSYELCVVYVPSRGFGVYKKVPNRCIWTVRSEKPKSIRVGGETIVFYDRRNIYIPTPTGGEYRDFTYGYKFDVDPAENAELLRLALASLMIILRKRLGIAFETIMYDVVKVGETKYFNLHEPESAGLIDSIDWDTVRRAVEDYTFTPLDRILLSQIDELAYSTLVSYEFNWEVVRQEVLRVVDYIVAKKKLPLLVRGVRVKIPKPSKALKIGALYAFTEVSGEDSPRPVMIAGLSFFDGEDAYNVVESYPPIPYIKPPESLRSLEALIAEKVDYEDYKLVVESKDKTLEQLKRANLRTLVRVLENAEPGKLIDVREVSRPEWLRGLSLRDVLVETGLLTPGVSIESVSLSITRIFEKGKIYPETKNVIEAFLAEQSRSLYLSYLLLTSSEVENLGTG
ncbi:DEAD/DEAH box helicase [Thermogladius sp. KZ2Tp1]|uniref:DEAD/DEAH box helicase n=1 Tax=Thermogladius sp. KZ2Tp1 TaxID=3136289 RepID=UPI003DAA222E